jgi:Plastocyanin
MTRKPFLAAVALAGLVAAPLAFAGSASVTIQNYAFHPATLTVAPGTTVTWTNDDGVAHTVTAADGSFKSGGIDHGKTFSHTFSKAGDYKYHCSYHSDMNGEVVVK